MNYTAVLAFILLLVAAWFAWRYYNLRRNLNDYVKAIRQDPEQLPTEIRELENLYSAVNMLVSTFDIQLWTRSAPASPPSLTR